MVFPNNFSMEKLQNFLKIFHSFIFFSSSQIPDYKWCPTTCKINESRTNLPCYQEQKLELFPDPTGWESKSSLQGNAIYIWIFTNTMPCLRSPVPLGNVSTVTPKDWLPPWEGKEGKRMSEAKDMLKRFRRSVQSSTEILANTMWCQTPGNTCKLVHPSS